MNTGHKKPQKCPTWQYLPIGGASVAMTWISSIASMCEIGPNFKFSETHFPGPIWLDLTKIGIKLSFEDGLTIIWPNRA